MKKIRPAAPVVQILSGNSKSGLHETYPLNGCSPASMQLDSPGNKETTMRKTSLVDTTIDNVRDSGVFGF
jgi:hypothetical protein